MVKFALIGIGSVASFQREAINLITSVCLSDVYDTDTRQTTFLPDGIIAHSSLDSLLKNSQANIFVISTPNDTHFKLCAHLLKLGKNVLVEKPACLHLEQLIELGTLANTHNAFFHVAFHARFAREVDWWTKQSDCNLGNLIGFNSGFFDPYVEDGKISSNAMSLNGSWIDSGINALSVISRFLELDDLRLHTARMTRIKSIDCDHVQGNAIYSYHSELGVAPCVVDTNWTLGLNEKTTCLWYEHGKVLLDHSIESVYLIKEGKKTLLKDLRNNLPRLTNHYYSLIEDTVTAYEKGISNMQLTVKLHRLMFEAINSSGACYGTE